MLADMVESGDLPAADERLPVNPREVQNLGGEPGVYGGELRVGFVGTSPEWGGLLFVAAWESPVTWKPDFSGWEPNIVESVEANADATEYTFYLREGLKWSDGDPYDADDIMFYIDDVLLDPDQSPTGAGRDHPGRDPGSDAAASEGLWHDRPVHHPRPGGGGRDR